MQASGVMNVTTMTSTKKTTKYADATPGFAIKLTEETNLGLGMLIAEFEGGSYQPIASISTIAEAREIAAADMDRRMQAHAQDENTPCPACYKVWGVGLWGHMALAAEIEA
jgi:hypothetical protein